MIANSNSFPYLFERAISLVTDTRDSQQLETAKQYEDALQCV
jgi:hypothetical protein